MSSLFSAVCSGAVTTTTEVVPETTTTESVPETTSTEYLPETTSTESVPETTTSEPVTETTTSEPANVTAPEFLGPFYIYIGYFVDYYFICRLTLSDSDIDTEYDVALMFDGELDLGLTVKTATAVTPNVTFAPSDFGQHFGQWVIHVFQGVYVSD